MRETCQDEGRIAGCCCSLLSLYFSVDLVGSVLPGFQSASTVLRGGHTQGFWVERRASPFFFSFLQGTCVVVVRLGHVSKSNVFHLVHVGVA